MANTAQARKRARQAEKRRQHNASLKSEMRTSIKKVRKLIASGDKAGAQAALSASFSTMDSVAGKGVIHRNTTARTKSRLTAAVKALA
ncbi:MAG: 30S ribosomal protein S20 [Betaproteobacteria bacterium]|nr:30S ribosomal protein S20 [Betaproteobacteria bacterium]